MFFKKKKNITELKEDLKEKKVSELINLLLESNVKIFHSQKRDEYFIQDKDKGVTLYLSSKKIIISNDQNLYEMNFRLSLLEQYVLKIKNKMEEKSIEIKKELFTNEIELIDKFKSLYR